MKKKKTQHTKSSKKHSALYSVVLVLLIISGILSHLHSQNGAEFTQDVVATYTQPKLEQRITIGNQTAPITIIVYARPGDQTTKEYMEFVFPWLNQKYIQNEYAQFIIKPHVEKEDADQNTTTFLKGHLAYCVYKTIQPPANVEAVFSVLNGQDFANQDALRKNCEISPEFKEDIFEVERFGMRGKYPITYVGVGGIQNTVIQGIPSQERFREIIREKQILVGQE